MNTTKILMFFFCLLAVFSVAFASDYVLQGGLDEEVYLPDSNISVSGTLYQGTSVSPSTNVTITLNGTSTVATTDENGSFSAIITAPSAETGYEITVAAEDASLLFDVIVTSISSILLDIVDDAIIFPLEDIGSTSITTDIENADKAGELSGFPNIYYVVQKNEDGEYDTIFMKFNGADADITLDSATYKYLEEGSIIKNGGEIYKVVYIDPAGSLFIIAKQLPSIFSGGESTTILAVALDESGSPLIGKTLNYELFDDKGNLLENSTLLGTTDGNGTVMSFYSIEDDGRAYHIIVNSIGYTSYKVEKFEFNVEITTPEGDPAFVVAPSQELVVAMSILDDSTGEPVTGTATVVASIAYEGITETETMTITDGSHKLEIEAPDEAGRYSISLTATYNNQEQTIYLELEVKGNDLYVVPMAEERGESEGFSPGGNGALFITGNSLETGDFVDLAGNTNNCADVELISMVDNTGEDVVNTSTNNMNVTEFFTFVGDMPLFIQEDILHEFGEDACVMVFIAPEDTGVYDMEVRIDLNGTEEELHSVIAVQNMFVHAFPVGERGDYTDTVNPGGIVRLQIEAYDAETGREINSKDILSANLIEVFAENTGSLVTEDMLNETFNSSDDAILSFVVDDDTLGFHSVRFLIEANVTRNGSEVTVEAIGEGWFMEELYKVWSYTKDGMYGSDDTVEISVEVYDSSGQNPQEGMTVILGEVELADTFETVDGIDGTLNCLTDENGTCTLELELASGWESGGYDVEIEVEDEDGNTDFSWAWFEIRNFFFNSWTESWETSVDADVELKVELKDFDGSPINANVNVDQIIYFGTWESWRPPTVVNESVEISQAINGEGTITIPSGFAENEGQYGIELSVTVGSTTETTRAWVYVRPFVAWAEAVGDNFDNRFGLSDIVNITISGYEEMNWSTWPPTGTPHNITDAFVDFIEEEGKWEVDFKTEDEMITENNMTADCSGNTCYLTFNLSGFSQGSYFMEIGVEDNQGSEANTWFWFRVEALRITVPELIEWQRIEVRNEGTNESSFEVNGYCNDDIKPAGIGDCSMQHVRVVEQVLDSGEWKHTGCDFDRSELAVLLDIDNATLYVNNTMFDCSTQWDVNFTNAPNYTVGETFTDQWSNNWTITEINTDGIPEITVQSINGIVADPLGGDYPWFIEIDQSYSQSGTFYVKEFGDDEWANVDLNGNGEFGWDDNNKYFMVLADSTTTGVYDTVYFAEWLDTSTWINTTDGFSGNGDIRFNASGQPIFLINIVFRSSSGTQGVDSDANNYYQPTFSTNKPGWPGRDLGTVAPGTIVKVPIMVTSPSNESDRINNTEVRIDEVISFGGFDFDSYSPTSVVNTTTDSSGLAILGVNTSDFVGGELPSGNYFFKVKVKDPDTGQYISAGNEWDNPKIMLRSFDVNTEIGTVGNIQNFMEISENMSNLHKIYAQSDFDYESNTPVSSSDLSGDIVQVSESLDAIGHSEYALVVFNHNDVVTPWDSWNDTWQGDRVHLVNSSNKSQLIAEYNVTEEITELDGWYVIESHTNADYMFISNFTINNQSICISHWNWDNLQSNQTKYFMTTFTEVDAGTHIGDGWAETLDSTTQFYMLLADNDWDEDYKISEAQVDDDACIDTQWYYDGQDYIPYDFIKPETENKISWGEMWIGINEPSWPFQITTNLTSFSDGDDMEVFSFRDWTEGQNLKVWISARDFNGVPVSGNATIDKVKGFVFGCHGGADQQVFDITDNTTLDASGTGFLNIDVSTLKGGDYSITILVEADDGKIEKIQRQFWVDDFSDEWDCDDFD